MLKLQIRKYNITNDIYKYPEFLNNVRISLTVNNHGVWMKTLDVRSRF